MIVKYKRQYQRFHFDNRKLMSEKIPDYSTLELLAGKLKNTRMRSTLSLDEISRKLMIQKRHLKKIEAGRLHFLPMHMFSPV